MPRAIPIALLVVVVLGGAIYGLTALLGSSGSPATSAAGLGPQSATTAAVSIAPKPITWLGMEIATVSPGAAVIETVAPGSLADLAGLEPGDVILQINNRQIKNTGDIAPAVSGLHAGRQVEVQVANGSTLLHTQVTLAAPPSKYP